MKKRLLSLLLAVVLCIGLLPVGALATDGDVTIKVDGVDKETGDINESDGGQRTGPVLTSSDTNLSGQFYIVQGDVTINGDLTVDGSKIGGLVLCADATLTVTGALIYSGGSWFSIYGQTRQGSSQSTGKLIIENSNGDGAAIRAAAGANNAQLGISSGVLEIHDGGSEKLVDKVYLYSTQKIHKAILDDTSVFSLSATEWNKSSLDGGKLVIEYCEHEHSADQELIKDTTTTHRRHCKACGFTWDSEDCDFSSADHCVRNPDDDNTHIPVCECGNQGTPVAHTSATVPTANGQKHISGCAYCDWTASGESEHDFSDGNGSCKDCGITPIMRDSDGDLYDKENYEKAFEKAADSNGAVTLTLVSEVTDEGANIWTKSIEFNYPGKSVTLDMGGITLSSTGEAALLVSGGELIIQNAATLEGASASGELSSTPAIKVTGGKLTFKGTVNATGGAKNSSAAPAILIGGGTVAFEQDVTATAVENEGLDTAIAPAIEVTGGKAVFHGKVTATGGLKGVSGNVMTCEPAIKATGGELEFNGDLDLNGGLTITGDAKLTKGLTRGTFKVDYTGERVNGNRVSVVGSANYKNLNSLLAADRAFVSEDETRKYPCVGDNNRSWGGDVTIQEHTHVYNPTENYTCECGVTCDHSAGYENGRCKTCKMPCPHRRLGIGDRDCLDCGQRMYVVRQTKNSSGNTLWFYYTDLPTALAAAEDGDTVKLVDDIDQSNKSNNDKTACLTGDGKTVTLNLNGKNITGGWIYVGIDQDGKAINSSRLNITGSGSFDGMIGISAKGTLDLSGWDGGTIKTVSSSQNGSDESTLISGENKGTINTLSFSSWPSDKISKTKLTGGTYGSIPILMNSGVTSISFSDLLAPGYAFQYADGSGSFVNYATKATYDADGVIYNVKVVKCTTHVDAKHVDADGNITDGADNLCDYCNANLTAATVATLTVGGATYYYTDLPSALKAASDKGGTVQLQKDVTGVQETLRIDKEASPDITLDLNGHTISGAGDSDEPGSNLLSVYTWGSVTIDDSSSNKAGKIECTDPGEYAVYVSGGTLTIKAGTYKATDIAGVGSLPGQPAYALGVGMTGELIINGGTSESQMYVSGGNLTINGGTFKEAVTIAVSGTEIKGGTFNGAFTMSAQPDVFSGGMFKEQASFSNVSNILTGGTFEKGLSTTSSWPGLASLLKRNYKYKTTGGWHYLDSVYNVTDNVTVAEVPIHSPVSLIAYPGSKEYGKSQDITLSASCGGSAEDLYVGWFLVHEDGTQDLVSNGGKGLTKVENKSATYTLPAGLAIGSHTYRVFFCDKKVQDGENTPSDAYIETAEITIEITKIDIANVPEDQIELELAYGGNAPYDINGATNADGVHATTMALSPVKPFKVNGTVLNENDYTLEGNVQYGVGEYTLKINVDTAIYTGFIERTWHIIPRKLGLPGFLQGDYEKTYDGETALPKGITYCNGYFEPAGKDYFLSPTNLKPSDYTLTNESFENATVGEDKRISFTLQLTNKNYEFNTSYIEGLAKDGVTVTADAITYTNCIMPPTVHFNITPATVPDFDKAVTLEVINDLENTYTIDLPALPALENPRTYGDITYTVASQSLEHGYATLGQPTVKQVDGKYQLCLTVPAVKYDQETSIGTILVKVTTTNYNDVVLTVNLQSVNKRKLGMFVSVATDPVVYGMTLGDIKLSAQATDGGQVIPGTIAWEDPLTTVPAAGQATYRWTFTPDDTMHYLTASNTINFLVDKATPTGGGSSSASKTSTTTNADGSVTKTETKKDGTVVETTTGKDGSTTKTETKKDGSSVTESKDAAGSTGTVKTDKNGQTTAETALSNKAIEDAKRNGEPVKAPVEVKATRDSSTAPTVKIELPRNSGDTKVEIPVTNVKPGTVAVLVHPDGTEEIVKNSLPTEDGIQLTINGGATVKIVDNSKGFIDIRNHWAEDEIDFVSARGLVNGMSDTIYAPNNSTTRAQLWTILARQADADLTGGSVWYEKAQNWAKEKGISDGTNPNGTINRAQMVTMLWRTVGQPAPATAATFTDISADAYYAQAVSWAVAHGITTGVGGGRFDPNSTCTRAQIATFLYRLYLSR